MCVTFVRIACLLATQETWFKFRAWRFSLFAKANMDSFQAKDKTWLGVDTLLRDFQHLIDDQDTADVLFLVGQGETAIYAHRLILLARCRHFQNRKRELFSSKSVHSQLTVRKPEFRPDVFREVLTFIYSGKVILKRWFKSRTVDTCAFCFLLYKSSVKDFFTWLSLTIHSVQF